MSVIGKSHRTGKLELLTGILDERMPSIRDGLTHHFPFDGSTVARYDIENAHLNILSYNSHATTWNMLYQIKDGNISNGTVTTNDGASIADALTYDMIVCDEMVWAVDQAVMNTLKTFADAGCVIWATGNDTSTNDLILTRAAIGTETVYTSTIYTDNPDIEVYLGEGTAGSTVDNVSSDPIWSLATLHADCVPLYWHDFVDDSAIMGFLYLPKNGNGGSLFFDMHGYTAGQGANWPFLKHLLQWQLNRKQVSSLVTTDDYTTHMVDGVSVEAVTTNKIGSGHAYYPNFRPYSGVNHSNQQTIVTDVPPAIDGIDVYRITDNAIDTQNQRMSIKFDIVNESIWDVDVTYSIYIWLPEKFRDRHLSTAENMFQNTTGTDWHGTQGWNSTSNYWGAGSIESNARTPDLSKTNCWQKYSITGKALVANRYNKFGDTGTGDPDNKMIAGWLRINVTEGKSTDPNPTPFFYYITAPQLEVKNYHTEFVDGSRSGNGDLIISGLNIDTATEDFTVNFEIDTNGLIEGSSAHKLLLNNFGWFRRFLPTSADGSNRRWILDYVVTGTRRYGDLNSATLFDTGYETITITWDRSSSTYGEIRVFRNGVYWEQLNGTADCDLGIIDFIQIVDIGASIKNLSLFNKELSDDQIYELANTGMSFTDEGDLIAGEVREFPDLPSTYYTRYFPLGHNADDKNNIISPATETNLVHENRSLWIGQETINVAVVTAFTTWSNSGTREVFADDYIPRLFPDSVVKGYRQLTDGSSGFFFGKTTNISPSTVYSASVWMWIDCAGVETNIPYFREYYGATNRNLGYLLYNGVQITWQDLPQRRWIRLELENKTTAADTVDIQTSGYITKAGTMVFMTAPQFEEKPFVSPYVNGTRGNTDLYYSNTILNQAAGAICGWYLFDEDARTWTGIGNDNNFAMLFSTWETGPINRLDVRSYYTWTANRWQVNTTDSVPNTTSTDVYISEGWHFVCLAWDDSTGYSKFFVDTTKEFDKASYLPDAYSSNLRIGDWNNGTQGTMNQYVRDLIILDYYPSDEEVLNIYRKTMSSSKDVLRVNYEVLED